MAIVRIDKVTYTEFSDEIVQVIVNGFQCGFGGFGCEQVRLDYLEGGLSGLIGFVTPISGEGVFRWNPISLSPGTYQIRATGTESGMFAIASDFLTVVPFTGGGVDGEILEAKITPAGPAVNQNFQPSALVHNTGGAAAQFYFVALYLDTAGTFINSKRSDATGTLIQPGATQLLSTPLMLATTTGKVIFDLRTWPNNVTIDIREVPIVPTGGDQAARVIINYATLPASVTKNVAFIVPVSVSEVNGLSGTYRIVPLINGIRQTPVTFSIAGGASGVVKNLTFNLSATATIAFAVETFINNAWISTDTEAGGVVTVLPPVVPPPPPPNGPPVPPPPPTPGGDIPLEYLIVGAGLILVTAAVVMSPKNKR